MPQETKATVPRGIPVMNSASGTVRTFMFAVSTERGPKLIAFCVSNLLIGRLPDNHLSINHTSVSRRHAKIAVTNTGVSVEDMGSQNGTTLNGVAVKEAVNMKPGDILRIGHVPLYYFGFIQADNPPKPEVIENNIQITPILPTVY